MADKGSGIGTTTSRRSCMSAVCTGHRTFKRTEQLWYNLRGTVGDGVLNRALEIGEYLPSFLDTFNSAGKVIVEENHVGSLLRYVRSGYVHRYTQIGFLQGWRVVDTIAGTV